MNSVGDRTRDRRTFDNRDRRTYDNRDRPSTQYRSQQHKQNEQAEQRLKQRGDTGEICTFYLKNQQCRNGDACRRLHLVSMEATRDVRPGVTHKPTAKAKELARANFEFRNTKGEAQSGQRPRDKTPEEMDCLVVNMAGLGFNDNKYKCKNPYCTLSVMAHRDDFATVIGAEDEAVCTLCGTQQKLQLGSDADEQLAMAVHLEDELVDDICNYDNQIIETIIENDLAQEAEAQEAYWSLFSAPRGSIRVLSDLEAGRDQAHSSNSAGDGPTKAEIAKAVMRNSIHLLRELQADGQATFSGTFHEPDEMGPPAHMIRTASESESYVMLIDESHEDRIIPCDLDADDLADIVDLSRLDSDKEYDDEAIEQSQKGTRMNSKRMETPNKEETLDKRRLRGISSL